MSKENNDPAGDIASLSTVCSKGIRMSRINLYKKVLRFDTQP